MSLPVTDTDAVAARYVDTIIIGSGFAGLGAAIKLSQQGSTDFLVLERGSDVGGTWRDNTYPGAACDVPSHLYSYSFALNPDWTRSFSRQPEIQKYIESVARQYRVYDRHVFDCHVESARWNTATSQWDIVTTRGNFTAKKVVSAVGALCEPNLPDIAGITDFQGEIFHSARWNHDASLEGKRVAVIGTGASAIQIVPAIAPTVAHLDVYQRTAPWVLPRFDREYTRIEKLAFKYLPGYQRLSRTGIYAARETQVVGLTRVPKLMKAFEFIARRQIAKGIRDTELRRKVTPNFRIGCKRMLISNNYYPALDRPNVDLVTDGIREVRAHSIVTADGTEREIDALVVATGFHVTDSPTFQGIFGKDGRSLAEVFDERGQQGYKGATVAGFPNLFFLVGPNTGLGHTSMVFMIESQLNYVIDALNTIDKHDLGVVEVRREVQDEFNADLQTKLNKTVWLNGGCASWYLDKHGNNTTLWPDFTFEFRRITRNFDLEAYDALAAGDVTRPVSAVDGTPTPATTDNDDEKAISR
ncbi:NAD(P)/FAD-dependent oxidoreductase [Rhodococcus sp. BP-149]|jgi:cyclohexanone monooxygenase|uniref:flavin-containing monooxygenase n=1 Tax=unclassified Rhodococcus (in: high G+C Gram-positive bacteria) TaxID=192944 RepID=UPI0004855BD0|nr:MULTISPECIES: NAD(P)/FAD-dependent oxidoreductase [unclassified Rhodococcus (in: high G+C Gram-positive bacteria)]KQU35615.1 4-hydroxyacetophenone monooxygenase [Rhodococcus sp. Leaf225]KQU48013.1 4-hydroxyacetophenone monooxygenase [Rhodococcus sp. Leaf258]MBY6677893.1 NAD(P)/FAD-dependent oxidoreductase [Rhodococcus sp. BP-332]MBY6684083.1 NAD(P)/FAD-dependent oxidoreductase [Rhodococcus sp. BP-288]MBY6693256.1 NAD(P)/FAD-dependent oxidoreductase [Rhodococcus sp. BP-188]